MTLLDEQGLVLTEVRSHLSRSQGRMLVDWATRPDALFRYYFDCGGRSVTAVIGAVRWSAVLATRWQMGARFWFLHTFNRLRADSRLPSKAIRMRRLRAIDASPAREPIGPRAFANRGVPA